MFESSEVLVSLDIEIGRRWFTLFGLVSIFDKDGQHK